MGSKINWNAQSVWYCINTCVIYQKITAPYPKAIKINKTWWANQLVSTNQLTSPTAKFNHHEKIQVQKWANYATKHRHFGMKMAWVLFNQTWHHSDRVRPWSRLFLAIISMAKLLLNFSDMSYLQESWAKQAGYSSAHAWPHFPGGKLPRDGATVSSLPVMFQRGWYIRALQYKTFMQTFSFSH